MSGLSPQNDVTSTLHKDFFEASAEEFAQIPGSPIAYWLSDVMLRDFDNAKYAGETVDLKKGLDTGNNERFLRFWFEISNNRFTDDGRSNYKWYPYNKGGDFRKWYGNRYYVISWENHGAAIMQELKAPKHRPTIRNVQYMGKEGLTWTTVSSGAFSLRYCPAGSLFDNGGCTLFCNNKQNSFFLSCFNSNVVAEFLYAINPTLNFQPGTVASLPLPKRPFGEMDSLQIDINRLVQNARSDWDSHESSWDFEMPEILKKRTRNSQLLADSHAGTAYVGLERILAVHIKRCEQVVYEQKSLEIRNNQLVAEAYGIHDEVPCDVPIERVSLKCNPAFVYPDKTPEERDELFARDIIKEIISYAVGCMFGRYSLDKPGLILASQGETLEDYYAQIPNPSFEPDRDNVIPVTGVDCFEDDIVSRFRKFLEVTLGKENLAENIAYIQSVLSKDLKKYFVNDFYNDHVKMYKNRPIYWQYSSRTDNKGSFKALVYLHRYTPKTNGTVLGYLRDYTSRITGIAEHSEKSDRTQDKRASEKLHKAIAECKTYEDQTLYPLATRNLEIDLDDGVLVNYLRLGKALRKISAIEKKRKDVESWTWPVHPLGESTQFGNI